MTDSNTRIPIGSDVTQRTLMQPAFSNDLLEQVTSRANQQEAWKRVRANKGAGGIDQITIDVFLAWVREGHWELIEEQLATGEYRPSPVRRVEIAKPDGGIRLLGIPTIADRVIQQAIAQVLMPIVAPAFSDNSFEFRPGRNGHQTRPLDTTQGPHGLLASMAKASNQSKKFSEAWRSCTSGWRLWHYQQRAMG